MKKSLALILGLCIFLSACTAGNGPTIGDPTTTPPTSSQTTATTAPAGTGGTDETVEPSKPDGTLPYDPFHPTKDKGVSSGTEPTEETMPSVPESSTKEDEDTPRQPEQAETDQFVTTQPSPIPPATQSPVTVPLETQPPVTDPPATAPPTTTPPETVPDPTESPTEPTGCAHEWICVSHAEEGHWRAGVVCDCGWKVYGNADEVVTLWNTHSASYSPLESLLDHGGYGCIDEWIVDKPAYDEWVCRHCRELRK